MNAPKRDPMDPMEPMGDPLTAEVFARFRAMRHHFESPTLDTLIWDLMLTQVVVTTVAVLRSRLAIERDVQTHTRASKNMRDFALAKAVEWGYLRRTEWRGRPAWDHPREGAES